MWGIVAIAEILWEGLARVFTADFFVGSAVAFLFALIVGSGKSYVAGPS
jgi:hypothetical protein